VKKFLVEKAGRWEKSTALRCFGIKYEIISLTLQNDTIITRFGIRCRELFPVGVIGVKPLNCSDPIKQNFSFAPFTPIGVRA